MYSCGGGGPDFREYVGPAKDISHAIGSPAAVFLIAGSDPGLIAGGVPFSRLDRPDQVDFYHLSGFDSHVFCNCLNLFDSHVRSLN